MNPDQDHGDKQRIALTIAAPIEGATPGEKLPKTMVAVFDDNDVLLARAPVLRSVAKVALPIASANRMVRVFHAPLAAEIEHPTAARLRRNLAVEERVLARTEVEIKLSPALLKNFRRSCCRVRGRVVEALPASPTN